VWCCEVKINVIGAGQMAPQIAALFTIGGFDVHIWSRSPIDENLLSRQSKILARKLGIPQSGQFFITNNIDDLPNVVTIESITESLNDKRDVYSMIRRRNDQEYFTNTSSYSPLEIAEDVGGLHFFNPISLKLAEIFLAEGMDSTSSGIKNITQFLDEIGFTLVNASNNRGYIGNYILFLEISNVLKLVEVYGYKYSEIEKMYRALFMGRDVISILDLVGTDVSLKIIQNLNEVDSAVYVPEILGEAVKNHILGRKNKTSLRDLL